MGVVQVIAATSNGGIPVAPPSINFQGPAVTTMVEGGYNALYINVVNYPATTLYWKVWNWTTTNTDWANGDTPGGTIDVVGTGQFQFQWQAAADRTAEGTEQFGVAVATDPAFNNQLFNQAPFYISDTSSWGGYRQPFTYYWNSDAYANSTSRSTSLARSRIGGMDTTIGNSEYAMSVVGTPSLSSITYANATTGNTWVTSAGNFLSTPDLNATGTTGDGCWAAPAGLTFELWIS